MNLSKRCFNTKEAMTYLGIRRKFFDMYMAPLLKDKGVRAGTAVVYEKADLDEAWDRYKLTAGSERTRSDKGEQIWDVRNKPAFTRRPTAATRLTHTAADSGFDAVVSMATRRQTNS